MRTGCYIAKKEIVAVCLEDVSKLRHNHSVIHQAIIRGNFGKVSEVKDFLNPLKKGNVILRSVNGVRRRGIAIYMASLPVPMQQKLWKCEYSQEWEIVVVLFFTYSNPTCTATINFVQINSGIW